jgi:hypothetical protein
MTQTSFLVVIVRRILDKTMEKAVLMMTMLFLMTLQVQQRSKRRPQSLREK